MQFYQYIANQPLLTFLVLFMGIHEETTLNDEVNIVSQNDCEMTKMRTKKIILSKNDKQINVASIDENLRNRDISPSNKYYRSILKNNKPGIILLDYKDIEYE